MKKLSLTLLAALVATSISANSAFAFDKDHSTLVFSKSQGPYSELFINGVQPILEKEGYTTTVHGKGSYVLEVSQNEVKENCLRETEELLSRAIEKGKCSGITYQEMQDILSLIMEDIYDSH